MSADLLQRAGEALYGLRWQSELARDLDVADRTVRRWLAGETPIPDGVAINLIQLCLDRAEALDALIADLRQG
jgi:hypothetical protein